MENMLLEHLDVESLFGLALVMVQLLIALVLVLYLKSMAERLLAWKNFKANLAVGVGTRVSLAVGRVQFCGTITSADKYCVVIANGQDSVHMDTKDFVRVAVIVHGGLWQGDV